MAEYEKNGVKILWVCTAPIPAPRFADMLSLSNDDIKLPASPYYDYPFKPATSISEYVVFRILMERDLYSKYDGKTFDDILDDLAEAARLLGKKYVIYLDEEGDGTFDEVIFTNREELVEEVKCMANELDKLIEMYESRGNDVWEHAEELEEDLQAMLDNGVCSQ